MTRKNAIRPAALALGAFLTVAAGCGKKEPPKPAAPAAFTAVQAATLPAAPDDAAWGSAGEFTVSMLQQDMVDPRKLTQGVAEIKVKAITDGKMIAYRIEWEDTSKNDVKAPAEFHDACAVQMPATWSAEPPSAQMGQPGQPVIISYWASSMQAIVDGRPNDLKHLYPNAQIDHYPFQAPVLDKDPAKKEEMEKLYAPAHALGNDVAAAPTKAVQDLTAEGPGTLRPAATTAANGKGVRTGGGWAVVIVRPLPSGLAPGAPAVVAFAVWNGSSSDVGSRKMRSEWVPLTMPGGGK